jgi:hypothetical protein
MRQRAERSTVYFRVPSPRVKWKIFIGKLLCISARVSLPCHLRSYGLRADLWELL